MKLAAAVTIMGLIAMLCFPVTLFVYQAYWSGLNDFVTTVTLCGFFMFCLGLFAWRLSLREERKSSFHPGEIGRVTSVDEVNKHLVITLEIKRPGKIGGF